MIYENPGRETSPCQFVLAPNQSLRWEDVRRVIAAMTAVALTIGLAFCYAGLTLVLPFSGLEILALAAALYYCQRRGAAREVLRVDDREVVIESGHRRPENVRTFQRAWVRVSLYKPAVDWYPSRLMLGSHGRELEVGKFLTEDERQILAQRLKQVLRKP
ncbi:MAG TPA: DUF2244 domain-containing protein [Gammaproteobacteria bacterium]|nr:DUF2244 domain-containing protein [Gammaproteobacteria bacterium]